jgi:hypothetical protein
MQKLQLNLFLPTFSKDYWGYVTVFETNNTNIIESQNWDLKSVGDNKSSLTADLSGNSIVFSPLIVDDLNNYWFIKDESENYIPQKQVITILYQEMKKDFNNNFSFAGKFESNTLKTKYEIPYTISAFIAAYNKVPVYPGKLNLIHEVHSEVNTLGNFDIKIDVSEFTDITHLQWGFKMSGYPVHPTESGNQGCVIITNSF